MEYVDAHCHTIISGHAYSTMRGNGRAAHEKGLLLSESLSTDDTEGSGMHDKSILYPEYADD